MNDETNDWNDLDAYHVGRICRDPVITIGSSFTYFNTSFVNDANIKTEKVSLFFSKSKNAIVFHFNDEKKALKLTNGKYASFRISTKKFTDHYGIKTGKYSPVFENISALGLGDVWVVYLDKKKD